MESWVELVSPDSLALVVLQDHKDPRDLKDLKDLQVWRELAVHRDRPDLVVVRVA